MTVAAVAAAAAAPPSRPSVPASVCRRSARRSAAIRRAIRSPSSAGGAGAGSSRAGSARLSMGTTGARASASARHAWTALEMGLDGEPLVLGELAQDESPELLAPLAALLRLHSPSPPARCEAP